MTGKRTLPLFLILVGGGSLIATITVGVIVGLQWKENHMTDATRNKFSQRQWLIALSVFMGLFGIAVIALGSNIAWNRWRASKRLAATSLIKDPKVKSAVEEVNKAASGNEYGHLSLIPPYVGTYQKSPNAAGQYDKFQAPNYK